MMVSEISNLSKIIRLKWLFIYTIVVVIAPIVLADTATPLGEENRSLQQINSAKSIITTHPACQATFDPIADKELLLDDFGIVRLTEYGKVQFINLWAVWCAPCRKELPIVLGLKRQTDATIFLLNLGDNTDSIAQYAKQIGVGMDEINTRAPDGILESIDAKGLPYNAVLYDGAVIGVRNKAIHDIDSLKACLEKIGSSTTFVSH